MSAESHRIEVVEDTKALTRAGADHFVRHARDAVRNRGRFTVVLSGGSTPKVMYGLLADEEELRSAVPWAEVHLFWGDERNVPADHVDSNYRMVREAMLDKLRLPPENVHPISTEFETAELAADAYAEHLRSFFDLARPQRPRFDLVFLGLGPDGHTASLFPGTRAMYEQERLVVAPWVTQLDTYRITMTPPVLNHAAWVTFLVGGNGKAHRLNEVLNGPRDIDRLPSQVIQPTAGQLMWLVDEAAASQLQKP